MSESFRNKGGYSSKGITNVCGTLSSLFKSEYSLGSLLTFLIKYYVQKHFDINIFSGWFIYIYTISCIIFFIFLPIHDIVYSLR